MSSRLWVPGATTSLRRLTRPANSRWLDELPSFFLDAPKDPPRWEVTPRHLLNDSVRTPTWPLLARLVEVGFKGQTRWLLAIQFPTTLVEKIEPQTEPSLVLRKSNGYRRWLKRYSYSKKLEIGDCNRQCLHLSSFPSEAFFIRFHISFS